MARCGIAVAFGMLQEPIGWLADSHRVVWVWRGDGRDDKPKIQKGDMHDI